MLYFFRFGRFYAFVGVTKEGIKSLERLRALRMFSHEPHKVQLLVIVVVDSNDGIYSIAYALLEVESKESWNWFEELMRGIKHESWSRVCRGPHERRRK